MPSITSANAVIAMAITNLFSSPQQLQGFAADDIFTTDVIDASEHVMGMDGILSAGYVPAPIPQHFALQANSVSVALFDTWYQSQRLIRDVYFAQATIVLTSIGTKWECVNGVLRNYPVVPDAQRVLQKRRFTIIWESVTPQPLVPGSV